MTAGLVVQHSMLSCHCHRWPKIASDQVCIKLAVALATRTIAKGLRKHNIRSICYKRPCAPSFPLQEHAHCRPCDTSVPAFKDNRPSWCGHRTTRMRKPFPGEWPSDRSTLPPPINLSSKAFLVSVGSIMPDLALRIRQEVAGGLIIPEVEYAVSDSRRFFGSALLFEAESLEAVRNLIEQDVYWTENVVSPRIIPVVCEFITSDGSGTKIN